MTSFPASTGIDESDDGAPLSLWWAPLDIPASPLRSLANCLSSEEQQRADRYYRPLDRERFMAARGWLRRLLASQLLCSPDEVRMVTGDGGKPRLARSHLRFNAARSGGVALYATSWRMEVGVNVEAIRATADVEGFAARFFSPTEQRALASLPAAQRLTASFHCWTRKEAYVKGIGAGLSIPLHAIDVWADSGQDMRVCGWTIRQVEVAFEFAAAVAGEELDGWVPKIPQELGSPNSNGLLGSLKPALWGQCRED